MRYTVLVLSTIALTACGTGDPTASDQVVQEDTVTTILTVDLAAQDMPILLDLGDANTLGVDSAVVRWNEEFGRVEVSAGEHFALLIAEDVGDLARVKADLERDLLQTHVVIAETPEQITYRSQFPDDAGTFIHFYRIVNDGGRQFVVRDDPNGRFNEADIARMAKAARTDRPI